MKEMNYYWVGIGLEGKESTRSVNVVSPSIHVVPVFALEIAEKKWHDYKKLDIKEIKNLGTVWIDG